MAANLKTRFRNQNLIDKLWTVANTYNNEVFNAKITEILNENALFHNVLLEADLKTWANTKFPIKRYEKNTSNAAESMNSMLKKFI